MEWNIIIISSVVSERDVSSSAPSRRRRTPPRANAIEDAHPDPPPPHTHTPTHPRVVDPQNSHTPRRPTIRYIHAKPSTRCDRTCGPPPRARAVPAVVGPRMGRDSAGDDDRGVVHRRRDRSRALEIAEIETIDRSSRVESSIGSGRSRSFDRRIKESKDESNRSIESRSFVVDDDDDGDAR